MQGQSAIVSSCGAVAACETPQTAKMSPMMMILMMMINSATMLTLYFPLLCDTVPDCILLAMAEKHDTRH